MTAGPDGAVWFIGSNSIKNEVWRVTTAGAITEYSISNAGWAITAGLDGALWFTEGSAHKIGRITTAGVVTEYAVTCCSEPVAIAAGPDGALWFTESGAGHKIGRITTAGVVTEYPLPNSNSPGAIIAGPDGALWFSEPDLCSGSTNRIGRITTAGIVTEYVLPSSCPGVSTLVVGADGAIWYLEPYTALIGRITTAGVITEYPVSLGVANSEVIRGLTAGPDGALWFFDADYEGSFEALGRSTTTGVMNAYGVGAQLNPGGSAMARGPDGALWMSDGTTIIRAAIAFGLTIITSLPAGANGAPYAANVAVQGGTPPYTWSLISGSLPAGLFLNPATGAISGTPTGSGSSFTVRVTDSSSPPVSATQALSINVSNPSATFSIAASPSGLPMSVDGVLYNTPHTFACNPGTQHTLVVSSPQPIVFVTGGRYSFTGWSDGVLSATRQITCPSTPTTYTANFITQYLLTTTVAPAGAGSITANPSSPNGFYNSGTAVELTASSNLAGWSGDLSGSANPQTIVMNGPKSVTANFGAAPPPTNLAQGRPATQSSTLAGYAGADAASAVDRNPDGNFFDGSVTATNADTNAWWQVDLGASAAVSSVVIFNRTDCCGIRLNDYWVFVSDTPFQPLDTPASLQTRPGTFGSHQSTPPNPSTSIAVGAQGRYVRVQLTSANYLSLAEVQVFGTGGAPAPVNLARGKVASQSSTLPGYATAAAAVAVDGPTDGNFFDGSVTATNLEPNPWWQVDLGLSSAVSSIVVFNRTDCCGTRLNDYWVFVSDTPFLSTDTPATLQSRSGTFSSHQTTAPNPSNTIAAGGAQGRYVRVQLSNANYLSLAEVQVFGH
jgi:virginiamycin B lyase